MWPRDASAEPRPARAGEGAGEFAIRKDANHSGQANDEIHVEFEVRRAEGAEAERLRLEQASVLKEVTEWLAARRQSEPGRDRAA